MRVKSNGSNRSSLSSKCFRFFYSLRSSKNTSPENSRSLNGVSYLCRAASKNQNSREGKRNGNERENQSEGERNGREGTEKYRDNWREKQVKRRKRAWFWR